MSHEANVSGWAARPIRRLAASIAGSGFPIEEQGTFDEELPFYKVADLARADSDGVIRHATDSISRKTASRLGARSVPPGSLVLAKIGAALMLGRIRIVERECCIDNNMLALVPRRDVFPRFLYYALHQLNMDLLVNPGAVPSLGERYFRSTPLPLPSMGDQTRTAGFLDRETARIDALIEKQTALIDRLSERRQSLIHRMVTGKDTGLSLADSAVPWIGKSPQSWSVSNIRRFAQMKTGHTPSRQHPEYWENTTIDWFTLADVWQLRPGQQKYLGATSERISELGLRNSAAELLPTGTVVLSRTASVGFSGIMPKPMATSQDYWNWVCNDGLIPEFLLWTFRAMQPEFDALRMGSTHPTIYQGDAASFRIVIPSQAEQEEVCRRLDRVTTKIDTLTAKAEQFMELARERRAALITAAVTGQIDVSEM